MLVNKYILKEHITDKEANSLSAIIVRNLVHKKTTVEWKSTKLEGVERRTQIKNYDLDEVIELFERKVKSNDQRFVKNWTRNLKTLKKIREIK